MIPDRRRVILHRRNWLGWAALAPALWFTGALYAAEGESGAETDLFNADVGNAVFTLIIFGAVVLILGKFAWKPILNVLHEREQTIRTALETAQREREQATKLLADYEAQLAKARVEATAIVAEGRRDAEAVKNRLKEDARQEGEALIARAKREIQLATDAARKELHDEVADLAVRVAGGILKKQLTPADHQHLVTEALQEMQAAGKVKMN